jgi:hypothetical protein
VNNYLSIAPLKQSKKSKQQKILSTNLGQSEAGDPYIELAESTTISHSNKLAEAGITDNKEVSNRNSEALASIAGYTNKLVESTSNKDILGSTENERVHDSAEPNRQGTAYNHNSIYTEIVILDSEIATAAPDRKQNLTSNKGQSQSEDQQPNHDKNSSTSVFTPCKQVTKQL